MRTIRYHIDKQAKEQPDKAYLFAPESQRELTYAQLRDESIRLGRFLLDKGIEKGDKVSFMMENGYQTAKLFLGVMYAGFVVAPLNLKVQPAQLEYVLNHSDTKLVFVNAAEKERLEKALKAVNRDIEVILIDHDAERILEDVTESEAELPEVDEEDPALLLYTSGTTGVPKGVVLCHRNMVAGGEYTMLAHELTHEDRALCSLPLYHINGEVVTAVTPLVCGGSVVMPHKFSASNFWELMSNYQCTWFSVVPTIISYLCESHECQEKCLNLGHVRFGRSASAPLPPSLHKEFEEKFGISIVETMGLTETAAPVFSNPMEPSKRKYGSPGPAVGNIARIQDPEGNEVPRGVVGEIMIKGDNVMKEYYKAPEITAQTIEPDGWLHTGDLGYMDEDGFIFVKGRIKELIIKGGENIAPREIDEVLYKHPAVFEGAAVGIPDKHYGEEILACVTLKEGCTCTEEELLAFCKQHLGPYKTPKIIKFLDVEPPKGPSGKIQRLKLREMCGF